MNHSGRGERRVWAPWGEGPGEAGLDGEGPKTGPRQRNFPTDPVGTPAGGPDAVCPAHPTLVIPLLAALIVISPREHVLSPSSWPGGWGKHQLVL